jgi:hypothetical protein
MIYASIALFATLGLSMCCSNASSNYGDSVFSTIPKRESSESINTQLVIRVDKDTIEKGDSFVLTVCIFNDTKSRSIYLWKHIWNSCIFHVSEANKSDVILTQGLSSMTVAESNILFNDYNHLWPHQWWCMDYNVSTQDDTSNVLIFNLEKGHKYSIQCELNINTLTRLKKGLNALTDKRQQQLITDDLRWKYSEGFIEGNYKSNIIFLQVK